MFAGCEKLTSIDFNFNAVEVTDISYLFFGCHSLESVNMNNFMTTQFLNMDYMFFDCYSLNELNLGWNSYRVKSMTYAFHGCKNITSLDLTNFDVKEVISMKNLFYKCKGLNELDLRGFNTLKCQIFDNMFGECNEMNVTIYNKYNEKLIAAAPNYIHFQTDPIVEFDFLADE